MKRRFFWGAYWYKSKQAWGKLKCYADSFAEAQRKVCRVLGERSDISICVILPIGGID